MSQSQDYIATHKVSGGVSRPQVNICNNDALTALGVRPGDEVGIRENGVGIILEPLNNGAKKRHTSSVYEVSMKFSEFECRMIGNRLWELAEIYENDPDYPDQQVHELKWWTRRFHDECNTRD